MDQVLVHHILHLITVAVSLILLVLAARTYQKTKNQKFLYICAAFALFAAKEFAVAIFGLDLHWPVHITNLIILALFATGVLK